MISVAAKVAPRPYHPEPVTAVTPVTPTGTAEAAHLDPLWVGAGILVVIGVAIIGRRLR